MPRLPRGGVIAARRGKFGTPGICGSSSLHARALLLAAIGGLAGTEAGIIAECDIAVLADPAPRGLPHLIIAGDGSDAGGEQQSQCHRRCFNLCEHLPTSLAGTR
jgi:hypothetical protein